MKTEQLTRVRRMFASEYAPREINRANQRKWVRSVRQLGAAWLLATPRQRQQEQA
jgi:hypothetical protein